MNFDKKTQICHKLIRTVKRLILLIFLTLPAVPSFAGTSVNVPVGDRSYELVEKLASAGLIRTPITGQRPWTRDYFADLIKEARSGRNILLDRLSVSGETSYKRYNRRLAEKRFMDSIIHLLETDFAEELEGTDIAVHPLISLSGTYTYLNNPPLPVPSNVYGNIDAAIHPLVASRQGSKYPEGSNIYLETQHSARVSGYFAAYFRPQFQLQFPSSGNDNGKIFIKELYAKTGINDLELEVGRDQLLFGQGLHGGLIFSDNARGQDMVKLSTARPLFGLIRATAFISVLGNDQVPSRPWLAGGRIDAAPFDRLDIGLAYVAEMHSGVRSGRKISADTRLTLKECRGLSIYGEAMMDNNQGNHMAYLAGLYMPHFDYSGKWSIRAEYEGISDYVYRSTSFNSGWASDVLLIGNISGPGSNRVMGSLGYHFSAATKFEINIGYLGRSNGGIDEHHTVNTFALEAPFLKLARFDTQRFLFRTAIGWDYVTNNDFVKDRNKADLMFEVGLKMNFPEF